MDKFQTLVDLIENDDDLVKLARKCDSEFHDDRWCATCNDRQDGAEAYREFLLLKFKATTGEPIECEE